MPDQWSCTHFTLFGNRSIDKKIYEHGHDNRHVTTDMPDICTVSVNRVNGSAPVSVPVQLSGRNKTSHIMSYDTIIGRVKIKKEPLCDKHYQTTNKDTNNIFSNK